MIKSYYESGGSHEQYITKYFSDNGYRWDCYTNYDDMDEEIYTCCPLIVAPLEVIKIESHLSLKEEHFFL